MNPVGIIYETTDYSIFKVLRGNRPVTDRPALAASLKKDGQLRPIIVNEKMEVCAGQHTLHESRKLKKPVQYIIVPGMTARAAAEADAVTKAWSIDDYVNSNEDNARLAPLRECKKELDLDTSQALIMLCGAYASAQKKKIAAGEWQWSAEDQIDYMAVKPKLLDILGLWSSVPSYRSKVLYVKNLKVLRSLMLMPQYDHVRFLDNLRGEGSDFFGSWNNISAVAKEICRVHNRCIRKESAKIQPSDILRLPTKKKTKQDGENDHASAFPL